MYIYCIMAWTCIRIISMIHCKIIIAAVSVSAIVWKLKLICPVSYTYLVLTKVLFKLLLICLQISAKSQAACTIQYQITFPSHETFTAAQNTNKNWATQPHQFQSLTGKISHERLHVSVIIPTAIILRTCFLSQSATVIALSTIN